MDLSIIFHIFSTIGFGLALLLAFRIQKNLLGHPSRIFLTLFLLIYFLVGISNVLKQGGITNYFDRFEYFAEMLFPPAFLFFIFPIFSLYIFSIYMKQDFEKRMEIEESLIESEKKFRHLSEEIADGSDEPVPQGEGQSFLGLSSTSDPDALPDRNVRTEVVLLSSRARISKGS